MKKLYTVFFALGLGSVASAQTYDISLTTDNYTTLESTSDDPLELDFTITNIGATTIPTGDTLFFVVTDGSSAYWSTNTLQANYVTYTVLTAPFAPSDAFTIDVATIDMQWVYDNIGLTGTVCVSCLGVNIQADTPPTMATAPDGNCVNYTVTEVAGINGEVIGEISVYPNPATTAVNFDLAGNSVDVIRIFDMSGREVSSVMVTGSIETVNTEDFENGMYFYQMFSEGVVVRTDKFSVVK